MSRKRAKIIIAILWAFVLTLMILEWLFPSVATFMLPFNLLFGVVLGMLIWPLSDKRRNRRNG